MERYRKLTLLHSNDMHGDFLAEDIDDRLVGGVSLLSGYVNKVRREEPNTLYCIAGDMFRGSIIDSEYRGLSTIEIMNMLAPDIATIGNHETDYGLAHLLFIEKLANFPIINANLHIKNNGARLFEPCRVIEVDGMKILFIGLITEAVIAQTKSEQLVGAFVDVYEAAEEVGRICNAYNAVDIDFTVLLTHIGFEEDKVLASALDPAWGVDVIIGGHSHTFIKEPAIVNHIAIVQAGTGTDLVGRFDITVDTEKNCIADYRWTSIPIDETHCERNEEIETRVRQLKAKTDKKYNRVITTFKRELHHPTRFRQTELGGLVSDAVKESMGTDVCLLASGSVRTLQMGPVITVQTLKECFPYDDAVHLLTINGALLKKMLLHIYRDQAWNGGHTEFYQLSDGMEVVYSKSRHEFLKFNLKGKPIQDEDVLTVSVQNYHFKNMETCFGITPEEANALQKSRVIATSVVQVVEEYFTAHQHLGPAPESRLIVVD